MSGQHATHGPVAHYEWRVSPWDHKAHAYRALGEVTSEAICQHSSSTKRLGKDDGTAHRCPGCLVAIGQELVEQRGDVTNWRMGD